MPNKHRRRCILFHPSNGCEHLLQPHFLDGTFDGPERRSGPNTEEKVVAFALRMVFTDTADNCPANRPERGFFRETGRCGIRCSLVHQLNLTLISP